MLNTIVLAAALASNSADVSETISVTASREPVSVALSGTALTIIGRPTIEALSLPLVKDYLSLVPSVSLTQSGPLGQQVQVRIRGAEANHTLSFIDGIEIGDPASSGEFRFDTMLADGIERIEVLRGPQSALWGSQAIGGVINIITRTAPADGTALYGEAQAGSLGTVRTGIGGGIGNGTTSLTAQASYLRSDGYDIAGVNGDKDGYENFTLHAKARTQPTENLNFVAIARYTSSEGSFDGFDYDLGVPEDALSSTRTRQLALRGEANLALLDERWSHQLSLTYTNAANINRNAGAYLNRSDGGRTLYRYQTSLRLEAGETRHRITAALEHDRERFSSADIDPEALSNQRRSRLQTSLIGEYRFDWAEKLGLGFAARRDLNNRFANATTVRATAAAQLGAGFNAHASYGTGVTDPTFFDLFGFFPGFFLGNPNLKPERSRSYDAGLGWSSGSTSLDLTWYNATLDDEIVSTYDFSTFLSGVANATGRSRRKGLEASARTSPLPGLTLAATYAYLDATDQRVAAGLSVREIRRPKHSGSATVSYTSQLFDIAASAAFTGARNDTDFSTFSAVRLAPYTLVTLSGAWHLTPKIDLTARLENALDRQYQDVFAYNNPGLTAHAGLRIRL